MKPTRIAPAANGKAIREPEEEQTKRAYLEQPDAEGEADDWSASEEWTDGIFSEFAAVPNLPLSRNEA
jgi:hypothetical protein